MPSKTGSYSINDELVESSYSSIITKANISSVIIGSIVPSIGSDAFKQCSSLASIIFESESQNKFHFDVEEKIYDYKTGKSVKDSVKILKTNSIVSTGNAIGYPIMWQVVDTVKEADDDRKEIAKKVWHK